MRSVFIRFRKNLMRELLVPFCCLAMPAFTQSTIQPKDLAPLRGNWVGELFYIDYTNGTPVTIPATLLLLPIDERSWLIGHGYPNEPHVHELDTLILTTDGHHLDGADVLEVTHPGADSVSVVLGETGQDNEAPAQLRRIWTYSPKGCTMRKEVRTAGATEFTLRHEYRFHRLP